MLKPQRNDLRRSPRKTSTEPSWIEGPPILWDHAQRKKAKKEDLGEYRKIQCFIASQPGAPPLSSPSNSSAEKPKSTKQVRLTQHEKDLAEYSQL